MNKLCFTKFKRGQIWSVKKDRTQTINGIRDRNNHLIEKSRSWLIVSTDISNKNSPILNCVPVTSRLSQLPPHVTVRMEKGLCDIQCEQITTLNKSDFEDAIYIGELIEENMQKIEVALANQLGLSIQIPSLESLKIFIEKLANAKAEEMRIRNSQVTDDYVLSIAEQLESIFNIPAINTVTVPNSADSIKPEQVAVEDKNAIQNKPKIVKTETPTVTVKSDSKSAGSGKANDKKRSNFKWTKDAMIVFIEDSEKLTTEEMSKKYNMPIKTIYSNKWRFKKLLNND